VATIVSVHSFRGGTGKSNTTANLAAHLALRGQRVGVIDTDIQSPGIHVIFGLSGESVTSSLNDYLWGGRAIEETAQDVTPNAGSDLPGKIFLIPSSIKPGEITRVLREGYDAQRLTQGLVISQTLVVVMRPDRQDYEGTGITVKVAQGLQVPRMMLVVNKSPLILDPEGVKANVERAYGCEVAAVLPHSDDMLNLASEGIFSIRYPDHELTALYRQIADRVVPA
jgi:septum site-determining protein MinD